MSEPGTVEIVEETGEPIAKITVGVVELAEDNDLGAEPGFYFSFPKANPEPGSSVTLYGPAETREDALESAGSYLIDLAESEAEATQDLEQELAA